MTDTAKPTPPTDRELILQSFAEQGLSRSQAEAALAATPPATWAAIARPQLERWADAQTAAAKRAYDQSPEGRLAAAERFQAVHDAEQAAHARNLAMADKILAASGAPAGFENLPEQDRLIASGVIERPANRPAPYGQFVTEEGDVVVS